MKILVLALCMTCGLLLVAATATAQTATPPAKSPAKAPEKLSAEQVLDRAIEAGGGRAAMEKHSSLVLKANVDIAQAGLSGTSEVYSKAPNKFYSVMNLAPIGTFEQGYDGQKAWESDPLNGMKEVTGPELALIQREAVFNGDLQWRKLWKSVEAAGQEEVGGRPAYKLVFTPHDGQGNPVTQFYDAETFLLVRSEQVVVTEEATIPVTSTYSDYRTVGGVKLPFLTEQTLSFGTIRSVVTEAAFDVPIDDAKFTR